MTPPSKPEIEERHLVIDGRRVPRFFYGTAWKEDATERLAGLALGLGFRAIDTANQRKHYFEAAVGAAVQKVLGNGMVKRDAIFVQTKFTHRRGQDDHLPYDPRAPIADQVRQSFASSLDHLGLDSVDSYVLHGPSLRDGLADQDWEAWRAMEEVYANGGTRFLGVSNVSLEQVKLLCAQAKVPPRFVQNRCYASRGWDQGVRRFCKANNIAYQGFSLLTANRGALQHPSLLAIAKRHGVPATSVVFRFALDVGMIALTGTSSPEHMKADLAVLKFRLDDDEVKTIEGLDYADPKKVWIAVKKS
jgi:diketogulonate reductase-like aldo/keto reductase